MQISEIGEFGLLKKLRKKCTSNAPEILSGIGDDAAAIKISHKKTLITADMLIEGVHFDLSFTTYYQLGYKFLAVNICDIFAMGGNPRYFLISLGIPKTYTSTDIDELYSGINEIAKKFKVAVVGGDTCASKHGLILSGTLIGNADRIIKRSGAKEGDSIFITNTLGDSAMGLMLLKKTKMQYRIGGSKLKNKKFKVFGKKLDFREIFPLLKKHLMPEPVPIKDTSKITSMIDVSDGLLKDLNHICDESRVGAVIYKDKIPLSKEFTAIAKILGIDPIKLAIKGGEDYALLFTAPRNIKTHAFQIGEIINRGRFIVSAKGERNRFIPEGYEHFK